ncbi:MAG: arylamine N-acetyltransferase [Bacteroidota bacterium]
MDTTRYLARINYAGDLTPSVATLGGLQEAHLLTIPFENLDIHLGEKIVLDIDRFYRKIVENGRGGFCYELNGLFHSLLRSVGFDARMVSARVYDGNLGKYGPEFDHLAILVDIDDDTWLTDVGFGDFTMRPLRFVLNALQADRNGQFLIENHDSQYVRVSKYSTEEAIFVPQYIFTTREQVLDDFTEMCTYQQTSSESYFKRKRLCSLATTHGRITLTDDKVITTEGGNRTEFPITNSQEFAHVLKQYFGVNV